MKIKSLRVKATILNRNQLKIQFLQNMFQKFIQKSQPFQSLKTLKLI